MSYSATLQNESRLLASFAGSVFKQKLSSFVHFNGLPTFSRSRHLDKIFELQRPCPHEEDLWISRIGAKNTIHSSSDTYGLLEVAVTERVQLIDRRHLLSCAAASAAVALMSPPLMIAAATPAGAVDPATAVTIGLSIANALSALTAKGGGLGEQFAVLNLKVDQILQNQIRTFEAIQQLQQSISKLETQIGGLFTEERYKDLAIAIYDLRTDTVRFLESINGLSNGDTLNPTKIAEYNRLLSELGNLVSKLENTFLLTNLNEQKVGLKGIDSLLVIVPALPVLVELLDGYRNVENLFPNLGLEASEYLATSRTAKAAFKALAEERIPEAMAAQVNEAKTAMGEVKKSFFGANLVAFFPASETQTSREVCFQTPGYRLWRVKFVDPDLGIFSGEQHDYRLVRKITFHYRSVHLEDVVPDQIIYPDIGVTPREAWKLETSDVVSRFSHRQPTAWAWWSPSTPAVSGCYDGMGLIPPGTPQEAGFGRTDDESLMNNFNVFLPLVARYNNAAIAQAQMIAMRALSETLAAALAKFDEAVLAQPSQNLRKEGSAAP